MPKDKVVILIGNWRPGNLWMPPPEQTGLEVLKDQKVPDLDIQLFKSDETTQKKEKRKPRWQRKWK